MVIRTMGRFSINCRKTKTNHNSRKQFSEPITARSKNMSLVPSVGKRVRVNHLVLVLLLLLIGRGSGARFFNQSQSVAMQNQSKTKSNCEITFDTQLKTALLLCVKLRDFVARIHLKDIEFLLYVFF